MAKREFNRPKRVEDDEFEKKLIEIRRVTKVVKGGRNMRFSALVVVGDKKGKVGMGIGKATEIPMAIEKATKIAKKNLLNVPIVDGTVPHEVTGRFSSSSIVILPSKKGSGIIAGGAGRTVLELAGYKDVTSKIHGSTNKINCVKATLQGLKSMRTAEQVAMLRGLAIEKVQG